MEQLEDRMVPSIFATGSGAGSAPIVNVYNSNGVLLKSFNPYNTSFTGGVHVAVGDVTGDGVPDIVTGTGGGVGSAPHVKVFDGAHLDQAGPRSDVVRDFMAYNPSFTGGVWVAVGHIQHKAYDDIVTGPGQGMGPKIKVFDGQSTAMVSHFYDRWILMFTPNFTGGVRVATGDVYDRGFDDTIIDGSGPGVAASIGLFDGAGNLIQGTGFSSDYTQGVFVASADMNHDGYSDIIITSGAGRWPWVEILYSGPTALKPGGFFAFKTDFMYGVRVAVVDLNGDGEPEIIVSAGPGTNPRVKVFNGADDSVLHSFDAYAAAFTGGVYVGAG